MDILDLVPVIEQRACQKEPVKRVSLSETIRLGMPCLRVGDAGFGGLLIVLGKSLIESNFVENVGFCADRAV